MRIINARPISKTTSLKQVVFPAGLAFLWLTVIIITFLAQNAHGQTFVPQQATVTLMAGSQDVTQFGFTGFTLPGSGVILQGTAISAFTGRPVRHLWYGDALNGLCRIDPEIDAPSATPVNGIGAFNVNVLTCASAISGRSFTPGQMTFDSSTNTLYSEDISRTAAGILRLHYLPGGDNGQGSFDLIHIENLLGELSGINAFGGCPQLHDPHNGNPVPLVPSSAALGPDGNLYTGSIRDGAIIRINSPATYNPLTDCPNAGDTGQSPTAKVQIPILSADERFGIGHTFGLAWIGHTLLGADNIAPWALSNADSCLTAANGNNTCANPLVGGAPLPTEFAATQVGAPQGGAASDAAYPANAGSAAYFATLSNVARVTNLATGISNATVNPNYGGTFPFITGMTADPQDPAHSTVYVGSDPAQGAINGEGQIWKVSQPQCLLPPGPPPGPTNVVAQAGPNQATVSWVNTSNCPPATSYVVLTMVAGTTSPAVPDLVVSAGATGIVPTTATVTGLTAGTSYQFQVQACNAIGCTPFSALSLAVTPFAVTVPPPPTNVVAVDTGNGIAAAIAWTQSGNGNSPINFSTITPFLGGVTALPATVVIGAGTGGTVTGLTCGNSYTFTVTATNAVGASAASAPSALLTLTCPVTAEVSVLETAPAAANPGTQVTYTISIHNNGPAGAASVTFAETLPAPFVSTTFTQGVCAGTVGQTPFNCNLGSLPAGASATVTVTVQLPASGGPFTNALTVNATNSAGANMDPNLANNTASATVGFGCEAAATTTDVQVTGSSNNGNPVHGTPVTFTWQIKDNQGSTAANCSAFTATAAAPTGDSLTINSASTTQGSCAIVSNQLSCALGTIAGGATVTVTISATPSAAAPANSYGMTGVANFTGTDTNTANNSSTVLIGAQ